MLKMLKENRRSRKHDKLKLEQILTDEQLIELNKLLDDKSLKKRDIASKLNLDYSYLMSYYYNRYLKKDKIL